MTFSEFKANSRLMSVARAHFSPDGLRQQAEEYRRRADAADHRCEILTHEIKMIKLKNEERELERKVNQQRQSHFGPKHQIPTDNDTMKAFNRLR
jgi:protein subunit release factor B